MLLELCYYHSFDVIVIAAVFFGADHQRVPIASNGPAAIRPLLSHLLLGKQDLDKFSSNYFLTFSIFFISKTRFGQNLQWIIFHSESDKVNHFLIIQFASPKKDLELRRGITTRIQKPFFKLTNMWMYKH